MLRPLGGILWVCDAFGSYDRYDFDYSRFDQSGCKPKFADMGASERIQIEFWRGTAQFPSVMRIAMGFTLIGTSSRASMRKRTCQDSGNVPVLDLARSCS
jgi:hypothetical protein